MLWVIKKEYEKGGGEGRGGGGRKGVREDKCVEQLTGRDRKGRVRGLGRGGQVRECE